MDQAITIPAAVAMVPAARRAVAGLLSGYPDAPLIATELVTSAVRHADGEITLRVGRADGTARIEVHDQRGRHPRTEALPTDTDAPDGLALVSLMADIGSRRARSGDCVTWAVLTIPDAPDLPSGT